MVTATKKRAALVPNHVNGLFKALADPIRMEVVALLSSGESCVCDLMKETGLAQSRLSFHLKTLKDSGLIRDRQSGRWVYYKLDIEALQELRLWTSQIMKDCQKASDSC